MKKGAMFGLDARIALAIFGTLSVIGGVSLYTAVKNARAMTVLQDMQEIGKAYEQYVLDTGDDLEHLNTTDNTNWEYYAYHTGQLVRHVGKKGWKGPYLPYTREVSSHDLLQYDKYDRRLIHISQISDSGNWGNDTNWDPVGFCTTGRACSLWVSIEFYDEKLAYAIDKLVDDGDGSKSGDFRWYYKNYNSKDHYGYSYKISPIPNPND